MKKIVIIIGFVFSYIFAFYLGYMLKIDMTKEISLNGTYVFDENKDKLDVFNDSYLSFSTDLNQYYYIESSKQISGPLIKENDSLYRIEGDQTCYIVINRDNNVYLLMNDKMVKLYQYDQKITNIE